MTPRLLFMRIRILAFTALLITLIAVLEVRDQLPANVGPFALAWNIHNHPISYCLGTLAALILLAISARPLFSLTSVLFGYALIAYSSWVKIDYLGTPLTLTDVKFFTSNLAANSVLFVAYPSLGTMLLATLTLTFLVIAMIWRLEKRRSPAIRILASSLIAALTIGILLAHNSIPNSALPQQPTFENDPSVGNSFTQLQRFKATKERNIPDLLEIFFTDASTRFTVPPRISQQRFHVTRSVASTTKPDIFVVLEESTFDPRLLAECINNPECNTPLFTSTQVGQESGPLFVHTTAGGTWLSEFSFLSGFDWRVFGPAGAHAPLTIAPYIRAPLPKHLQKLGYQTVAIYPVSGNFLNARETYKLYGFEHFLSVEDLGLNTDWQHTSDSDLFSKSLETLDSIRDGRPVFVFLLTIRNHGPHAETHAELPQPIPHFLKELPAPLADYLLRLKDSENSLADLERHWLGPSSPRILAWFGDHQPLFADAAHHAKDYIKTHFNLAPEESQLRYVTWYSIRFNLTSPTLHTAPNAATDIAYLATRILEIGQLPPQKSDDATRLIQQICPYGIALCRDTKVTSEYLSFRTWELKDVKEAPQ